MSTERIHLPNENIRGGTYMVNSPLFVPYMGAAGVTGLSGPTGIQGQTGLFVQVGVPGTTGIAGIQGDVGETGIQGLVGSTGIQGLTGILGFTGLRGDGGDTGIRGITGIQGATGVAGVTGFYGQTGIQGILGNRGYTGIMGIDGETGIQGTTGIMGVTGLALGSTGIAGTAGSIGSTGIMGFTGVGANVITATQIPCSNGTSYQYGGLSYDGTTILTNANIFTGQTVYAGQFMQQASTYVSNANWTNGWRDTVAASPTGAMEYLEWCHFSGFGNWENFILRLRSDNQVWINNTAVLYDGTRYGTLCLTTSDNQFTNVSKTGDVLIQAGSTNQVLLGQGIRTIAKTINAAGNQKGFIINADQNTFNSDSSQFNFEIHGASAGNFAIQGTQTTNPGTPNQAAGVVLYFDGTDVYARRGLDGQASKLTASWA